MGLLPADFKSAASAIPPLAHAHSCAERNQNAASSVYQNESCGVKQRLSRSRISSIIRLDAEVLKAHICLEATTCLVNV